LKKIDIRSLIDNDTIVLKIFAVILSLFFIFILVFKFNNLPQVQGDVHLSYDPSLTAGTGRYLTNYLIINTGNILLKLFVIRPIQTFYILEFIVSILLILISFLIVKNLSNEKTGFIFLILNLTSNYYLTLTYGFEYHRFYGLLFLLTGILIYIKTKNILALNLFIVISILFSTAILPTAGVFMLFYFIISLIRKDYKELKKVLLSYLIILIAAVLTLAVFEFILHKKELHNFLYYLVENRGQGKEYTNIATAYKILPFIHFFEGKIKTVIFFILFIIGFYFSAKDFKKIKECDPIRLTLYIIVPVFVVIILLALNFTIIARLFFIIFPSILMVISSGIYYLFYENKLSKFKYKNIILYAFLLLIIIPGVLYQKRTFNAFHISDKVNKLLIDYEKPKFYVPTDSCEFVPNVKAWIDILPLSKPKELESGYNDHDLIIIQPFNLFKRDDKIIDARRKYQFYNAVETVAEFDDVSSLPFYYLHAEGFINFLLKGVFDPNEKMKLKVITLDELREKYDIIKDISFSGKEDLSKYKF